MEETWKPIKGYEDKYLISNKGNVKSLIDHNKKPCEKILTARQFKNGYMVVNLWKNSKNKTRTIHRLVAEAFIPNPNGYEVVNHKDCDKTNNTVENLEWCTTKQNVIHAIKNGRLDKILFKSKENNPMYNIHGKNHPSSKPVIQYDLKGKFIKRWENIKIAEQTLKIWNISKCCKNKIESTGGYKWTYDEY